MSSTLTQEIDHFKSQNKEIELIESGKLRTFFLHVRKSLTLQLVLQEDYPVTWPLSVKCQIRDLNGMKPIRQEAIQNFLKILDFELNQIIDLNKGKCLIIKMYDKIIDLIDTDQFLKESLDVLESKSKSVDMQKSKLVQKNNDLDSKLKKNKSHKFSNDSAINVQESQQKFKGSDFIFQRIKWDDQIDKNQVVIGYLDRFLGIKEIKFNEFKGVHDDRDGVPLHRVRYFKINEKIVWDREKKLDLITGVGDITNFFTQSKDNQEEFKFEEEKIKKSLQGRILGYQNLEWNDQNDKADAGDLKNLQILTYNIMSRSNFGRSIQSRISLNKNCGLEKLDQIDRMPHLLNLIETRSPSFVLLQECEAYEEQCLMSYDFIKNNYFICSMKRDNDFHSNCVVLSKIKPLDHLVYPLSDNSNKSALMCAFDIRSTQSKIGKKLMIINVHLSSNKVKNSFQKRENQLGNLKKLIDSLECDYMFIGGDFNFGDCSTQENELLNELFLNNGFKDLAPNCFTFDPSSNFCSAITSSHKEPRRMDRILFWSKDKKLVHNKSFLVNTMPFKIDPTEPIKLDDYLNIKTIHQLNEVEVTNKDVDFVLSDVNGFYLNPSDHYGLECQFSFGLNFDQAKLVHKSTLAVLVPKNLSDELIQPIRKLYDPQVNRWPPHLNILYPFYENIEINDEQEFSIIGDILKIMSNYESFTCQLTQIDLFKKNNVVFLKPDANTENLLNSVYSDLKNLFADSEHVKWNRPKLSPHLTIGQPEDKRKAKKNWAEQTLDEIEKNFKNFINKKPLLEFEIDCLYWMTRTDSRPFEIKRAFPLGKRYPSISKGLRSIDGVLIKFMREKKILLDEKMVEIYEKKVREVKNKIENLASECLGNCELVTIGSYQLGILSNDIDLSLVCAKNEYLNQIDQLTQTLRQDSYFNVVRPINDALVPIIELQTSDTTLSGIDIQVFQIDEHNIPSKNFLFNNYSFMTSFDLDYNKLHPLSGLFENDNLKKYVFYYKDFQVLLSFVKYWAQCRNIYGKAFGYLGGISWALMVVVFLKQKVQNYVHKLELDQNSKRFEKILTEFFEFYSNWNWNLPITVFDSNLANEFLDKNNQRSSINIQQTVYPYHNTSRIVNESRKKILVKEIKRSYEILKNSLDYELVCSEEQDAPFKKICFYIDFNHLDDVNHLFTLIKGKILGLVTNLEKTVNKLEFRPLTRLLESKDIQMSDFKYQRNFFILIYSSTNGMKTDDKEFVDSICKNFTDSIKSSSHVNEFNIWHKIF